MAHLQTTGRDLQILADVVAVQHGVDVAQVNLLIRKLTTLFQDYSSSWHAKRREKKTGEK